MRGSRVQLPDRGSDYGSGAGHRRLDHQGPGQVEEQRVPAIHPEGPGEPRRAGRKTG